jgi:predicted Zn-dependent peptidase
MIKKSGSLASEITPVFAKSTLKNGIRVVSELHTHTRAVSIGVWVMAGTRDENKNQAGISHFLEHLTFKGTKKRTSYQLAKALEEVGGELNAYTTREYTCYHALVLRDHWQRAVEVLSDLVSNMNLKEPHFQLEKAVVLQELSSSFENHEDHIYDEFLERAYKSNPLGAPILGTEKALTEMTRSNVNEYYRKRYVGRNILVSCAGNVDHDELVTEVQRHLARKPEGASLAKRQKPRFHAFAEVFDKSTDQTHMLLGIPSGRYNDPLRFEAFIVNALLGGGMTSKLFQSVRERKGLTYSVYSSLNTFTDAGILMVYAGVETDNLKEVVKTILKSMQDIRQRGVSPQHLKLFKTQVVGSILLGSDDVENRMTSLGINEMVLGRYKPVQEVIDEIQAVDKKSLAAYIEKYFQLDNVGGILLGSGLKNYRSWWEDTLGRK